MSNGLGGAGGGGSGCSSGGPAINSTIRIARPWGMVVGNIHVDLTNLRIAADNLILVDQKNWEKGQRDVLKNIIDELHKKYMELV
jgi:hypothetical protein